MRRSDAISLCAALVFSGAASADEAPERVVSMNHCADQYALLLGAPGQVVSVTHVAADPLLSVVTDRLEGVGLNRAGAEEIYRLDPDLVLASRWSDPMAIGVLEGLGVRVARVDGVDTLADIPQNIEYVAGLLGRAEVGAKIAADVSRRLADLPVAEGERPEAAFFGAGGYSVGSGSLADDIVGRAGFDNLADRVGRSAGGYLSVEVLLMERPDLLIMSGVYPGSSQAEALMDHPALSDIPRYRTDGAWSCGLPATLGAVVALIALRNSLIE
ncbi:MAG: ABC transporter substrate-binding protein [Silicimonas sp.]|nr:ABC transporter substrate-binding protein [Silicimonas sp.]